MGRYAAAHHAFTVDPVDGTKNFVHGSRDHAVMVSETRDGEAVRAWIWQPQHDLGYVAERGGGTWRHSAAGVERLVVAPPSGEANLRGRTSRRDWVGRSLAGLAPMALTWVSCGIDYPEARRGRCRLRPLPLGRPVGPRARRAAARRGGRHGRHARRPALQPARRRAPRPRRGSRPDGIRPGVPCARVERPPVLRDALPTSSGHSWSPDGQVEWPLLVARPTSSARCRAGGASGRGERVTRRQPRQTPSSTRLCDPAEPSWWPSLPRGRPASPWRRLSPPCARRRSASGPCRPGSPPRRP